jgi:ferric iron reductase protein FhuF
MSIIDYEWLEKRLYFTQKEICNAVISINAAALLQQDEMDRFIQAYMQMIKTDDPVAAGTYFCGWFRAICLVQQFAVSVHNTSLDLSLSNITVQIYPNGDQYWFSFRCNDMRECQAPPGCRKTWLREVFTSLYRDQVRPLIDSVSRSTHADSGLLWGQFPTGFHYYLDLFMEHFPDDSKRKQIADDYRFLSEELEGAIFDRKKNPFDVKIRYIESPWEPGKLLHMKTACCMYYRTKGGDYCYTCPKLSEAERVKRKAAIIAGKN